MFRNYFKIAWRNLTANKSHAIINLLGLAIGIACCFLIILWVADELSYDQWNEKANRIYRVSPEIKFGGNHKHYAVSPAPLAATLRSDFPEVETAVRFRTFGSALVKANVQNFHEQHLLYTDSTFFDVFSVPMLKGNPKNALAAPNTVVISETAAKRHFPNEDPIGKKLVFNNEMECFVTGVYAPIPNNTHFKADFLISMAGLQRAQNNIWFNNNFHTYYVLREEADRAAFEAKVFPYLVEKYLAPQVETMMGKSYEEFISAGTFILYHYQPLTDIHLKSDVEVELGVNGSMQYVWIFMIIALFILFIACVNFMNLSTAQSALRAKEIGVRKVLGSLRINLINQFLVESILLSSIALVLGMTIAQIALPYFNDLADKTLVFPYTSIPFWTIAILSVGLIGLLAGSYPAFYLSGFKPIKAFSGKLLDKGGNLNLRNSLVVFQFLIAVVLIIGTLVINQQINFIQDKKLGFERDQVLILDNAESLGNKAFTLKNELLENSKIKNVTISGFLPTPSYRSDSPLCKNPDIQTDNCISMQMWDIDEDYMPTMGMELVSGRNFSEDMPTDSAAVIINESAAALLGYEDPIGKTLYGSSDFNLQAGEPMPTNKIIGVVKDFHFNSLRQNIGALCFFLDPYPGSIILKVDTEHIQELIPEIEREWKHLAMELPFAYRFMDDSFDQVYRSEMRISELFSIFSILSILIACLGLFGLAAFATERRTKEIGIRKVLGATTTNLVALVSKDFLKPVIIALIIATPIAYYAMDVWLADFAYRIDLQWWVFALAGIIAMLIAFGTVSFQSFKAALANPIDALKNE